MDIVDKEKAIEGMPKEVEKGYTEAVETVVHMKEPDIEVNSCKRSTELHYPMFILKANGALAKHQAEVLKGIVTKEKNEEMLQYYVYIQVETQKVEIGLLDEIKLKSLLNSCVFKEFEKRVIFEDGETIVGDELFALCPLIE